MSFSDRYELGVPLGRNPAGIVYQATRTEDGATVALAVADGQGLMDEALFEKVRARFRKDLGALTRVKADQIPQVHEVDEDDAGNPYAAMALVEGESLGVMIDEGIDLETLASAVDGALRALEAAHRVRVVHGDLEPGNVLVDDDGSVKVVGFGLGRALAFGDGWGTDGDEPTLVARSGAFRPPDAGTDAPHDARDDLYAIGAILHLGLSGELPEAGRSIAEVKPRLAASLTQLVDRALHASPAKRYASAWAMRTALNAAVRMSQKGEKPSIRPPATQPYGKTAVPKAPAVPAVIRTAPPPPPPAAVRSSAPPPRPSAPPPRPSAPPPPPRAQKTLRGVPAPSKRTLPGVPSPSGVAAAKGTSSDAPPKASASPSAPSAPGAPKLSKRTLDGVAPPILDDADLEDADLEAVAEDDDAPVVGLAAPSSEMDRTLDEGAGRPSDSIPPPVVGVGAPSISELPDEPARAESADDPAEAAPADELEEAEPAERPAAGGGATSMFMGGPAADRSAASRPLPAAADGDDDALPVAGGGFLRSPAGLAAVAVACLLVGLLVGRLTGGDDEVPAAPPTAAAPTEVAAGPEEAAPTEVAPTEAAPEAVAEASDEPEEREVTPRPLALQVSGVPDDVELRLGGRAGRSAELPTDGSPVRVELRRGSEVVAFTLGASDGEALALSDIELPEEPEPVAAAPSPAPTRMRATRRTRRAPASAPARSSGALMRPGIARDPGF